MNNPFRRPPPGYPQNVYPFDPREAEFLQNGGNTPPLTPEDLGRLWAEGQVPPEFYEDPYTEYGLASLGNPRDATRRILAEEARLSVSLPETAEAVVKARGKDGECFRTLQPNNLGNGAVVEAGSSGVIIAQARGLDCLNPVAISLGYDVLAPEEPTDDIFVQALIKWGVGGAQNFAWVDVGRGTQIRLQSASFLEVSYAYLPDQSTTPVRTGPNIMGLVQFGYGLASFRASPARYTQRISTINSGSSSNIIPIPRFAQSFGVIGETTTVAGSTMTLLPGLTNDGHGHQAVSELADGQMENAYFVPNGFRAMQLKNGSGTAQPFQVVFALML